MAALLTDSSGRLAVALLSSADIDGGAAGAAQQQQARPLDVTVAYAGGSVGSGAPFLSLRCASRAALAERLAAEGLRPVAQPTVEQVVAAVPAALWGGPQAWGQQLSVALRALHCFRRDVEYLVRGGEVGSQLCCCFFVQAVPCGAG